MLSQQHMGLAQHLHQHCPADVTCPSYYGSSGAMVRYAMYCASVKIYGIIHGPLLWKSNGKCTLSTLHRYMVSHNAVHFGNKILCNCHIVSYYIQLIGSIIMGREVQRSAVKCVCPASYQV